MKQTDKPLLAIVGGVILLIIAVFVIVLRQPDPTYKPEDSPENIAHNYLLALRKQEYERAYTYLLPTLVSYPRTIGQFIDQIEGNSWRFRLDDDVSLAVESVQLRDGRAEITIQETQFYNRGLFDSYQRNRTFTMKLVQIESSWKISEAENYWNSCWHTTNSCR